MVSGSSIFAVARMVWRSPGITGIVGDWALVVIVVPAVPVHCRRMLWFPSVFWFVSVFRVAVPFDDQLVHPEVPVSNPGSVRRLSLVTLFGVVPLGWVCFSVCRSVAFTRAA